MTISLGRNLRSVVHNVRQSQRSFDRLQTRLASGKSVNRPIDNPSSFFTAKTLNERSIQLGRLMDNMGQAVSTVKAASEAIESAMSLVENAAAVAEQAAAHIKDAPEAVLDSAGINYYAVVRTETELIDAVANAESGQYIVVDGEINMSANTSLTLKDGQKLVGVGHFEDLASHFADETGSQRARLNFAGTNISGIITADNNTISNMDITLNLDTASFRLAAIYADDVTGLEISDVGIEANTETGANGDFGGAVHIDSAEVEFSGDIRMDVNSDFARGMFITSEGGKPARDISFVDANVVIDVTGDNAWGIMQYTGTLTVDSKSSLNVSASGSSAGGYGFVAPSEIILKSGSEMTVSSRGEGSTTAISSVGAPPFTMELGSQFIAHTEGNAHAMDRTPAFDLSAGAIIGLQSDGRGEGGTWEVNSNHTIASGNTDRSTLSGANYTLLSSSLPAYDKPDVSIPDYGDVTFDESKLELLKSEYNTLISQYDQLIDDGSYKGINLAKGDDLQVKFNATGTTSTTIKGYNVKSDTLGLKELANTNWLNLADVNKSIGQLRDTTKHLRTANENLSVQLNVVQSRQDFSKNMKDVLTVGADKLELADMNEESAKTLSIQTAVNLGMQCLSFATQHDRSILNAFQ